VILRVSDWQKLLVLSTVDVVQSKIYGRYMYTDSCNL
jgi:hypothetical protein